MVDNVRVIRPVLAGESDSKATANTFRTYRVRNKTHSCWGRSPNVRRINIKSNVHLGGAEHNMNKLSR